MKKENRMIYSNNWRKALVLSVSFFCAIILLIGCKKEKNPLGEDALPDGTSISSGMIDTFSLRTYSIIEDTVITTNPRHNMVGSYTDVDFGQVEASFYTQLSLSGFSPDFGDLNDVFIDSVVLAFRYGGYYGTPIEQLFEVYELDEDLSADSIYYSFSSVLTKAENLVPVDNNEGLILAEPLTDAIVGGDTVPAQLRIPLDTLFGRNLLELASNSASNEEFFEVFKGLNVKVNNAMFAPGQGAIYYLEAVNPASKLTVYYREQDTVSREFDFLISSQLVDFNKVDVDRVGTNFEQVLADTISGQQAFYAQSTQGRAKIEFPSISAISSDVVIQRAELELPISYFTGSDLYPSTVVSVGAKFYEDVDDLYLVVPNGVTYNTSKRAYIIDLRDHLQKIIIGERINDGIIVSPSAFNTTTERIVFNGPDTPNKSKPRLKIVYSEF